MTENFHSDTLYLDIFSGISGDMFLGALLDLGLDFDQWKNELAKLNVEGYRLETRRESRSYIEGVKLDVILFDESSHHDHGHDHHDHGHDHHDHGHDHHDHGHDHHDHGHDHHDHGHGHHDHGHGHTHGTDYQGIRNLILESDLSETVKKRSISIFHRIAVAEGKVHGLPLDEVHFHEVGAVDSIVDIVGACIAWEMLGIRRALSAPVVEGRGWIDCAHGRFPIPAAATLEILSQESIGLTQCDEPHELVTPTGAAILAEFCESFRGMENFKSTKVGYGIGTRKLKSRPNVLRAMLGTTTATAPKRNADWIEEKIIVLETNLDDCTPETLGHCQETLMSRGALDVYIIPMTMKKSRPAHLLGALCKPDQKNEMLRIIFEETTSFGIREFEIRRHSLFRDFVSIETSAGEIPVKIGKLGDEMIQLSPEYDTCRDAAKRTGIPLRKILDEAKSTAIKIHLKQK